MKWAGPTAVLVTALMAACCKDAKCPEAGALPPDAAVSPGPTATALADAERARVGALARLHTKGVVEIRTKDESGEHMDQGDLDLRWNPALGIAVSGSKLGDRWVWMGADLTTWWIFELKAESSLLRTGPLGSARAGVLSSMPWLAGARPLVPAAGAAVEPSTVEGMRNTVSCAVETGTELPKGAVLTAQFDAATMKPVGVVLAWADGRCVQSRFAEWVSVETPGVSQGAWPRMPKRIELRGTPDESWTSIVLHLESPRADPTTTDRPDLYNLDYLKDRFKPQKVEQEP